MKPLSGKLLETITGNLSFTYCPSMYFPKSEVVR
jgi:hypothetical protein